MEEQISTRDNKELRTAVLLYSTLALVVLAIGMYGFVSLLALAISNFQQGQLFG